MKLSSPFFRSAWGRSILTRLTLNHFTTLYFFFALFSCVVLVVLQAVTLTGNNAGVTALSDILSRANATPARDGLPMMIDGKLALCDGIPGNSTVSCQILEAGDSAGPSPDNETFALNLWEADNTGQPLVPSYKASSLSAVDNSLNLPDNCIYSLRWLLDTVKDSRREDVVTLCFQIWMFSLAFVTLLYESIPHLAAGLFGHILGTAWAAYRVESTDRLTHIYRQVIVPQMCAREDFLQNWWDHEMSYAIGIIVVNICTLLVMVFLSYKILKVYARQSFARVGTSDQVRRIYKIILLFSAGLQLTAFFSLASTSIWLDKISQGVVERFAVHGRLYLAGFILTLIFLVPWLVLGWVCVRLECIRRYGVFCVISLFLVTLHTALFFSRAYRFIFLSWSFFATITVTAYICILITAILGAMCRFNFGKGLAHYLQVDDALAGMNFTADTFYDHKSDPENVLPLELKLSNTRMRKGVEHRLILRESRGLSIYSHPTKSPIILSSTPADVKSLIAVPSGDSPSLKTKIMITRDVETKQDPLPPTPAKPRTITTLDKPVLRFSQVPERLSSLASLRQAINEFPLPPALARPPEISRYVLGVSRAGLSQDSKARNTGVNNSGWF